MEDGGARRCSPPALVLQSEVFPPTGGISSEGVRNALGRPRMELLEVLVREMFQNSWDARLGPGIRCGMHGWTMTAGQLGTLRGLLGERPERGLPLEEVLDQERLDVLAIVDRGTCGLDGPARADEVGDSTNFIDLVRNVGRAPDREHGAGTYGYGKGVLFLASGGRTILVHSHFMDAAGVVRSRLMVTALGEPFEGSMEGRRVPFTGRHWWGQEGRGGVVDPVSDPGADDIASRLGLPAFGDGETGTTIVVIAPVLGMPAREAMARIGWWMAWNFWPRMVARGDGGPDLRFEVSWDGEALEVPDPARRYPLSGFVAALGAIHSGTGEVPRGGIPVHPILIERPRRRLGDLALDLVAARGDASMPPAGRSTSPLGGPPHHVALLRTPELVVRYLEGPQLPEEGAGWVGVFRASDELDSTFARAEPPTHDDWIPDMVEGRSDQSLVRVALRRVGERAREFVSPAVTRIPAGMDVPLGAISSRLAGLVAGEAGTGAGAGPVTGPAGGRDRSEAGSGAGRRAGLAQVRVTGPGRLLLVGGRPAAEIEVEVMPAPGSRMTRILADLDVATADGGSVESEAPLGASRPSLVSWRGEGGQVVAGEGPLVVTGEAAERWVATITMPEDSVLRARFRVEGGGR